MVQTTPIVDGSSVKDTLVDAVKKGVPEGMKDAILEEVRKEVKKGIKDGVKHGIEGEFERALELSYEYLTNRCDDAYDQFLAVLGNTAKENREAQEAFAEVREIFAHVKDANKAADIRGLREQIMANARVLLPIVGFPRSDSFTIANGFETTPEIHIITLGEEPKVRAMVLKGSVTTCDKFLDATPGATTIEALKNLLALTQQMLELRMDEVGAFKRNFEAGHDIVVRESGQNATVHERSCTSVVHRASTPKESDSSSQAFVWPSRGLESNNDRMDKDDNRSSDLDPASFHCRDSPSPIFPLSPV